MFAFSAQASCPDCNQERDKQDYRAGQIGGITAEPCESSARRNRAENPTQGLYRLGSSHSGGLEKASAPCAWPQLGQQAILPGSIGR